MPAEAAGRGQCLLLTDSRLVKLEPGSELEQTTSDSLLTQFLTVVPEEVLLDFAVQLAQTFRALR